MKIKARFVGVADGAPLAAEGQIELKDGADLKKFFQQADQAMGLKKTKPFRRSLKQGLTPTVLLNGDRLDLPEGFDHVLADGDEVTVLLPMMGG